MGYKDAQSRKNIAIDMSIVGDQDEMRKSMISMSKQNMHLTVNDKPL